MTPYLEQELDYIAHLIKISNKIVVSTGAGTSAESGIDTFRGDHNSIWSKYKIEDVATVNAFRKDPQFVVEWYSARMEQMNKANLNSGHYALVELEEKCKDKDFVLITQNIDALHTRAGVKNSIEVHGNIYDWYCPMCKEHEWINKVENYNCKCGSYLRPNVVFFGEFLHDLDATTEALDNCDLFFSIGTSAEVQPAASFLRWAHVGGAKTIEINLSSTYNSNLASISLREKFGDVMPKIVARI